ncbi:endoribonuclease L-PSP [Pandoraea iniqua]|uniref:Endoribonuclease L-PSP n=1 Tax=Pandoraea iniqua TaxID=2508288 RepID=A0A5E4VV57_9BURK|nr:RidA family protein [Pandoraea iniqua]VVE15396.1 endoribonuclease L-PSP [Pandoraea iniqua]
MSDSHQNRESALPPAHVPTGAYASVIIQGDFAFVSGQLPRVNGVVSVRGRVGDDLSLEAAKGAARLCALNCLAAVERALGGLDNVAQICRVSGYVACTGDFYEHADVIDAASAVLVDMLGSRGHHSRTSIGVASLPRQAPVELDMIVSIKR